MSEERSTLVGVLARPADASYGTQLERWGSAAAVGTVAGFVGAMGAYVFRTSELAPAWASESLLAAAVVASGLFVKLLCQQMRASTAAIVIATVVGGLAAVAFEVAPYVLLDIGTLGGLVLLPAVGEAITFTLFGQFPLQLTGYLLGVVYDGLRA